jgi:hypothetical protein
LHFAGHYVPQLAQLIYEKNKGIQNPTINLKGFMVHLSSLFFACTGSGLFMLVSEV